MRIVFDCDGVLADFNGGFRRLAHEMFGTPVEVDPGNFTWDNYGGGITDDQVDRVWNRIKQDRYFWWSLEPLTDSETRDRICRLDEIHDLYFVTSRVGLYPKRQTAEWLYQMGIEQPSVIVSNRKGEICAGIGADYCIDDKAGNAVYVAYHSGRTRSYILDAPYNRFDQTALGTKVRRVKSVSEFLDDVEAAR